MPSLAELTAVLATALGVAFVGWAAVRLTSLRALTPAKKCAKPRPGI